MVTRTLAETSYEYIHKIRLMTIVSHYSVNASYDVHVIHAKVFLQHVFEYFLKPLYLRMKL